jgi:hypothetical protein
MDAGGESEVFLMRCEGDEMPESHGRWWAVARMAAAVFALALAGAAAGAEAPGGCPDMAGEYENRSSEASRGELYLSDLLGIEAGVMRIAFLRQPDGMILRAPRHHAGVYERFLPWSDFWCEGERRVFNYSKSNLVLNRNEGQPLGGSSDRRVAFAKSPEGGLLVNYSASGSWVAPALWGFYTDVFSGQGWARFEPYKR